MANALTLSNLAPTIYKARDIVARELTGAINSVSINRDGTLDAAYGDNVQSFITAQPTLNTSYTPAMTIPAGDDQTVAAATFALDQVANVRIPLTGESARKLDNSFGVDVVLADMFAQAIRVMVNAIETNICLALKNGASRATGTAGTTPFSSAFSEIADLRQILIDNGAPVNDLGLSLVLNSTAGAALRKLAQLQKVNESGDSLLRQGELLNLLGFSLKESAGIASHTKGTGASATTTNAGFAVGSTSLALASAGTGTLVAGDVVTFAGDTANKYVVKTGDTDVSDGGTLVLNNPGIRVAMSAATKAITVGNSYTANVALHRLAAELAMRAPAQPYGGDAAVDRILISDDRTGLTFDVAQYKGYGMAMFDITCFYGVKVWKPEFVATLLG